MIIRGSISNDDLKIVSGKLVDFRIREISGFRQKIQILQFCIENSQTNLGLYLNSIKDYEPIVRKIKNKDKTISIMFLDSWSESQEGINLHIYNIKYGNETLISIDEISSTDRKVGILLYFVGLVFFIPIIVLYKKNKFASHMLKRYNNGIKPTT